MSIVVDSDGVTYTFTIRFHLPKNNIMYYSRKQWSTRNNTKPYEMRRNNTKLLIFRVLWISHKHLPPRSRNTANRFSRDKNCSVKKSWLHHGSRNHAKRETRIVTLKVYYTRAHWGVRGSLTVSLVEISRCTWYTRYRGTYCAQK